MIKVNFRQSATAIAAILALNFTPGLRPKAIAAETPETPAVTETETETETETFDNIYDQAKAELPDDLYVLYRIVERIARANNLDEHPWRVILANDDEINAYASEANLIVMHFGLLDQTAGDASALACVVAHEMAHHTHQHAAIWTSQVEELREEMQLHDSEENYEEFAEKSAEFRRGQELEADAWGYRYAATAGFDTSGCLRGFDVLSRLPEALVESSTHPAVPKRIETLEALMSEQPPENLAGKGELQLRTTEPLTYNMLEGDRWLRINSKRGGSFVDDFERLFPDE
ncbi:MAG: M48 family metallopeptidase [Jaaginema sp. PMC 1079.18]|nr:M48 family metallopeptidase [Jaaginema sp. PMC 1080.18]MEC4852837.1 M48 family metallopeptidase [Jaaginema sp. PMC 1079.18]MEC4864719.1 M48 family metallopeptidase [Jaaginema sp. PMC 1078.18]